MWRDYFPDGFMHQIMNYSYFLRVVICLHDFPSQTGLTTSYMPRNKPCNTCIMGFVLLFQPWSQYTPTASPKKECLQFHGNFCNYYFMFLGIIVNNQNQTICISLNCLRLLIDLPQCTIV